MRMPSLAALLLFCLGAQGLAEDGQESAHDFSFVSIDGGPLPLSTFSGKVILIVNTASLCGFTKQYAELQALHERYVEKGLVVLGVPSNDFANQEPDSPRVIQNFCKTNYDVSFILTEKIHVKKTDQHPLYTFLTHPESNPMFYGKITWNFNKFLIDREGHIVERFKSRDKPLSKKVVNAIQSYL